jgi:LEA14-like dessication related protein
VVEVFLTKDVAQWRAEGAIGVQTPIGILKFPLMKQGDFEVPKIPLVAFANPRVTTLSLTGATIEFPLTVTNRNTYALPINGLTGAVSIAGTNVGTLSTGDLGNFQGKGSRNVSLPVQVNFFNAAGAVVNAARGGQSNVQLNANLVSGRQQVPIRVDQLVNFLR